MIDVNAEAEKTLSALDYNVDYYYPQKFNKLPVISFYTLTDNTDFSYDNEDTMQCGTVVVDVWSDKPYECGSVGIEVSDVMTSDGWNREFSRDLLPTDGIYHKTMRFVKEFINEQED